MTIIVNPVAGRGDGREYMKRIKGLALRKKGVLRVLATEYPGHGTKLAQSEVDRGAREIVIVGGDGTISEVVNGVVGHPVTIGIVPVGTGNDFARSLHLPLRNPEGAWNVIESGTVRRLDVGECDQKYFISSFGIGFPVQAVEAMRRMRLLRGSGAFLVGVLRALLELKAVSARIEIDGTTMEKDCAMVLVQNTPFLGGGLRIAPKALLDDSLLDVVVVEALERLNVLVNLPKVYRGLHENHPKFSAFRAKKVVISSRTRLRTMHDGEVGGSTPAQIRVHPGALQVIAGTGRWG